MEHAAAHGVVVHVPHLGADGHLHLDAVAHDVGRAGVVDGGAAVEVAVHLGVALVAAGAQQDALVGLDVDHGAVGGLDAHAVDAAGDGVLDQADDPVGVVGLCAADLGRGGHAVPAAAVLEGHAAVLLAEVAGGAHEVGADQVGELDEQGAVAKGAAAGVADLVAGGLERALDPLDVAGELGGQPLEVLLGHGVGLVHGVHVGAEGLDVVGLGEDDALAGGDGLAAGVLLVGGVVDDDVDVGVDLDGLDVGGGAGHAVADDDDVVLLVPLDVLGGLDPAAGVLVPGGLVGERGAGAGGDAQGGRAEGGALHEAAAGDVGCSHGVSPFVAPLPLSGRAPEFGAPLVRLCAGSACVLPAGPARPRRAPSTTRVIARAATAAHRPHPRQNDARASAAHPLLRGRRVAEPMGVDFSMRMLSWCFDIFTVRVRRLGRISTKSIFAVPSEQKRHRETLVAMQNSCQSSPAQPLSYRGTTTGQRPQTN